MSYATREKARDAHRRWREANREKVREYSRRWREANPDSERESQRRWYLTHRERKIQTSGERERLRKAARRARVDAIKLERGCADCGFNAHPRALDFDHLPGSNKVTDIARMQNKPWATVEAEMAKCEVVCANCHRIRTAERGYASPQRGSSAESDEHPSLFESEAS